MFGGTVVLAGGLEVSGSWQFEDFVSDYLLGTGQVILCLQVHPELRLHAEPVPKAESGVPCNGSFARDDLADPVWWHIDLAGKLRWSHTQLG